MIDDAVVLDELDLVVGFKVADLDRHARDRPGCRQGTVPKIAPYVGGM